MIPEGSVSTLKNDEKVKKTSNSTVSKDSIIRIEGVTKAFGSFKAVDTVSLQIPRGSFTTLLGPSGCGKTTLLRLIAGFYEPDGGEIYINEHLVNGLPPNKRNTPLVFQEYALFPHMTVFENIAYGLKLKKTPRKEIKEKVDKMLKMFNIEGLEYRFPKQLSGGQQQRVAFARALIMGKEILLLDEPLSNLDAKLRVDVRSELIEIQKKFGVTTIYVTHDQDEALEMSDNIAVLNKGSIMQIGSPWDIYFKPVNKFVANFVGTANFVDVEIADEDKNEIVTKSDQGIIKLETSKYVVKKRDRSTLVIRPECISFVGAEKEGCDNVMKGNIVSHHFLGHVIRYWVQVGDIQFIVDVSNPSLHGYASGTVFIEFDKTKMHILDRV